jgi:hypothetical protein
MQSAKLAVTASFISNWLCVPEAERPWTWSVMSEIQVPDRIDVEGLRVRLHKMTGAELLRFGQAARYMCSTYANMAKPSLEPFVIQLREARMER